MQKFTDETIAKIIRVLRIFKIYNARVQDILSGKEINLM